MYRKDEKSCRLFGSIGVYPSVNGLFIMCLHLQYSLSLQSTMSKWWPSLLPVFSSPLTPPSQAITPSSTLLLSSLPPRSPVMKCHVKLYHTMMYSLVVCREYYGHGASPYCRGCIYRNISTRLPHRSLTHYTIATSHEHHQNIRKCVLVVYRSGKLLSWETKTLENDRITTALTTAKTDRTLAMWH